MQKFHAYNNIIKQISNTKRTNAGFMLRVYARQNYMLFNEEILCFIKIETTENGKVI